MAEARPGRRPAAVVDDTTTGPDRRLRADAQRNRDSILRAAESVLAAEGVDAPIDDIARQAGVGVGTVYRHYPTKEALLRAIIVSRIEPMVTAAREACSAADPGEAFFRVLRMLSEEFSSFRAVADTIASSGFDMEAAKKDLSRDLKATMAELLQRAQQAGRVRTDIAVDDVAMLMAGLGQVGQIAGDPSTRTRCLDLVCDAMRGKRPHRGAAGKR